MIANMRLNSQSKKKRKQDPCTFCGKTNHRAKNCWENPLNSERNHNRVQNHKRRGNHQQNGSQRQDDRAQQVDMNIPILMMKDVKNNKEKEKEPEDNKISIHSCEVENEVIIDSRCSQHVCRKNYKRKLVNVRRGPTICIRMANGMTRESNIYRSLILKIRTDSGPRKIRLGEVLYIKEITNLLLSVGMIMSKGVEFHMA